MGVLRWLAQTLIGPILDGIAGMIRDWRANADAKALGASQQKTTDQGAALDASKRMQEAAAGPKGPEATKKALDDGSF